MSILRSDSRDIIRQLRIKVESNGDACTSLIELQKTTIYQTLVALFHKELWHFFISTRQTNHMSETRFAIGKQLFEEIKSEMTCSNGLILNPTRKTLKFDEQISLTYQTYRTYTDNKTEASNISASTRTTKPSLSLELNIQQRLQVQQRLEFRQIQLLMLTAVRNPAIWYNPTTLKELASQFRSFQKDGLTAKELFEIEELYFIKERILEMQSNRTITELFLNKAFIQSLHTSIKEDASSYLNDRQEIITYFDVLLEGKPVHAFFINMLIYNKLSREISTKMDDKSITIDDLIDVLALRKSLGLGTETDSKTEQLIQLQVGDTSKKLQTRFQEFGTLLIKKLGVSFEGRASDSPTVLVEKLRTTFKNLAAAGGHKPSLTPEHVHTDRNADFIEKRYIGIQSILLKLRELTIKFPEFYLLGDTRADTKNTAISLFRHHTHAACQYSIDQETTGYGKNISYLFLTHFTNPLYKEELREELVKIVFEYRQQLYPIGYGQGPFEESGDDTKLRHRYFAGGILKEMLQELGLYTTQRQLQENQYTYPQNSRHLTKSQEFLNIPGCRILRSETCDLTIYEGDHKFCVAAPISHYSPVDEILDNPGLGLTDHDFSTGRAVIYTDNIVDTPFHVRIYEQQNIPQGSRIGGGRIIYIPEENRIVLYGKSNEYGYVQLSAVGTYLSHHFPNTNIIIYEKGRTLKISG